MPSEEPHVAGMGSPEAWDEEVFLAREPDVSPPPYSPPSSATANREKATAIDRDEEEDEDLSDEDSIGGEFKDIIEAYQNKFGQPYNSWREKLPDLPAYRASFAKVENLCSEIFRDAITLLEASAYQDKSTESLLDMIRRRQEIKYDPPSRIGIIGDSGVGKSSLINAILDSPNLAAAGATGSALTCVITEFHYAPCTQETPFLATIELFQRSQIDEMLKDHLEAYYQFHLVNSGNLDEDESSEQELQARTALDSFLALFGGHQEFENEDSGKEFLGTATSMDDLNILQRFSTWIEDFMRKYKPQNGSIYLTASTPEELSNRLEPWVTSNAMVADDGYSRAPSLWPIVRVSKVGMQSSLLERGVVVVDLPGLSDTNKVRTETTDRYIRDCNYYFLVAPIARVQTDDIVHRRLMQAYKLLGTRKALIITKIDDMLSSTKPRSLGATPESAEKYNRLSQAFASAGAERNRLASLLRKEKGKRRLEIGSKMNEVLVKRKIYNALMRQELVAMRNTKVGAAMRKRYQTMTSDPGWLSMFYVSSLDYEMHKVGYDEEGIPLPLHLTGIPQCRYMISSLPADSKLNILRHHWRGNLMSVVDSLDTWSSQSAIYRRAELRQVVEKPRKDSREHVQTFIKAQKEALTSSILVSIKKDLKNWQLHSVRLSDQWMNLYAASFAAFVRKNGVHKAKNSSFRDWNSELLEPVVKDIEKSWKAFEKKLGDCREDCFSRLVRLLDNIRDDLGAIEGVSVLPMVPFLKSLPSKKEHLHRELMKFFGKFLRICRDARLDIIMEGQNCSLMQAMLPLYAKLRKVEGTSPVVRRKTLLKDSIARGEPFARILPGVQEAIEDGLHRLQPELVESIESVFDMVLADFDLLFVVEEVKHPQRDILREQIGEFVDRAQLKIEGQIAKEFALATKD